MGSCESAIAALRDPPEFGLLLGEILVNKVNRVNRVSVTFLGMCAEKRVEKLH